MILGRPTNAWSGLVAAIISFLTVALIQLGVNPVAVGTILGSAGTLVGVVILFIANQPAVIAEGSSYTVVTSDPNADNVQKVANPFPTPPSSLVPKTPTTS